MNGGKECFPRGGLRLLFLYKADIVFAEILARAVEDEAFRERGVFQNQPGNEGKPGAEAGKSEQGFIARGFCRNFRGKSLPGYRPPFLNPLIKPVPGKTGPRQDEGNACEHLFPLLCFFPGRFIVDRGRWKGKRAVGAVFRCGEDKRGFPD